MLRRSDSDAGLDRGPVAGAGQAGETGARDSRAACQLENACRNPIARTILNLWLDVQSTFPGSITMPYSSPRNWVLHRPPEHLIDTVGKSVAPLSVNDGALVDRIITAYQKAIRTDIGSNFWTEDFGVIKRHIHDALVQADKIEVTELLRNPHRNMWFHGFEMIHSEALNYDAWKRFYCSQIYDFLLTFCEAVGVSRLEFPEAYRLDSDEPPVPRPVEDLMVALDGALGVRLTFPNPYGEEVGIETSRGIASFRAVQAAYQAFRISKVVAGTGGPVVEIGGGLGRTAFYCAELGIGDYTIVDIPLTSAAQAYYLGRTCGESSVRLYGEACDASDARFNLIPPDEFFADRRNYGLAFNADSFPEISDEMASRYMSHLAARAKRLLSINHEVLALRTVRDIAVSQGAQSLGRHPYWLRRGYVDELFDFENKAE